MTEFRKFDTFLSKVNLAHENFTTSPLLGQCYGDALCVGQYGTIAWDYRLVLSHSPHIYVAQVNLPPLLRSKWCWLSNNDHIPTGNTTLLRR